MRQVSGNRFTYVCKVCTARAEFINFFCSMQLVLSLLESFTKTIKSRKRIVANRIGSKIMCEKRGEKLDVGVAESE